MKPIITSLFIVAAFFSTAGFASDYDTWIQDLAGNDDARRTVARQMLPREGMRAVPDLIELLQHDDQRVWRTSRNILADVCHAVTAPGFERERVSVTEQLFELLAQDTPTQIDIEVLRLLGKVASTSSDLSGITPYLDEMSTRTESIDALVAIASDPAARFLESQLNKGASQDTIEIVDALRAMGSASSSESVYKLLKHRDRSVQIAALRALASTGNPALIESALKLLRSSDFARRAQAADAVLALAESVIRRGGNWEQGIALYRELLSQSSARNTRGAALTALGRYGDASVIPNIFEAIAEEPELEAPALMGLDYVRGRGCYEALLRAYPSASEEMQLGLLDVMARKRDSIFLDTLLQNASSNDASRNALAFDAIVQSELPGGADAATNYVESLPSDARKFEIEKLLTYADALARQNATTAAGKAYLTLYRTTDNAEFREIAFQGIKDYPSAEAYEIILSELDLEKLSEASTEMLITLNVMIDPAQYLEESIALREALFNVATDTANVQAILDMAHQQGIAEQFIRKMGFLTQWHLVGPFPWKSADGFAANPVGAPDVDLEASYTVDGQSLSWVIHETGQIINALGLLGQYDSVSMYGYTTFSSEEAKDAQIRIGSDDGVRIWLNGQTVHENNIDRGMLLDQDIVPVQLEEGDNELLVQVTQVVGGWGFMARLTELDGAPIEIAP